MNLAIYNCERVEQFWATYLADVGVEITHQERFDALIDLSAIIDFSNI